MQKRQFLLLLFLVFSAFFGLANLDAQNAVAHKTTLLSHWEPGTLPPQQWGYIRYNSCWGHAVNGHEYAILGGTDKVMIVDVTDPSDPQPVASFAGQQATVWREFKSYNDRIYAVSDATTEGLMIIDMSQAPTSFTRTYYSNEFFGSSHTVTMDETRGIIFLNSSNGCIGLLDVSQNPDKPQWLGGIQLPMCTPHDSYYRNNRLYVSNGDNGLYIYDVTDVHNPVLKAQASTGGYNHSGTTNEDDTYFYYLEEIPAGRPGRIVDLTQVESGEADIVGQFFEPLLAPAQTQVIYHNPFRRDDLLYLGAYEDGLVVFDISDPLHPKRVAWYDTYQNTTYTTYTGVWSVYPWLPSGNVVVGDMVSGLYMVKLDASLTDSKTPEKEAIALEISPNPVASSLRLTLPASESRSGQNRFAIVNAAGQQVLSGSLSNEPIPVAQLAPGVFFVQVIGEDGQLFRGKFVKR